MALPYPWGSWFEHTWINTTWNFRLNGFWEDDFQFLSVYIPFYKFLSSYCDQTQSPRDHDLIKLKSSPPGVALTQVSNFLTKWFLRRRFLKNTNNILIPKYFPLKEGLVFLLNKLKLSIRKTKKFIQYRRTDRHKDASKAHDR